MADPIPPALSAEEWAYDECGVCVDVDAGSATDWLKLRELRAQPDVLPALIAIANAALPPDDRRKITHLWVSIVREAADRFAPTNPIPLHLDVNFDQIKGDLLREVADALESYLPPP